MKYLIFAISITFLSLFVASFSMGRAGGALEGNTGAPGDDPKTCGSCHTGGNFDISAQIKILDFNGNQVSKYIADEDYKIQLVLNTDQKAMAYGFQMVSLFEDSNTDTGGFSESSDDLSIIPLNGRTYIEQNKPLEIDTINFDWKAPSSSKKVNFYASFVGVDGNGNTQNDKAGNILFQLPALEVSNEETELSKKIFPNPALHQLTISHVNAASYKIFNMQGTILIDSALLGTEVDISRLISGTYYLLVSDVNNKKIDYFQFIKY